MCTVSWVHEADGYQVLFNRDEKRTRTEASGPRLRVLNGISYLTPVDGDFGGTWLAVNEFGVALCLLNGANLSAAPAMPQTRGVKSRGHLAAELVEAEGIRDVFDQLSGCELPLYAPFTLAVLEPGLPAAIVEWEGQDVAVFPNAEPFMPLLSSSFDTEEVRRRRREEYRRQVEFCGRADTAALWSFHSSHGDGPSAYSPCMHRPDAETVSFSWLRVDEESVRFFYVPGSPCHWNSGEELTLSRR